MNGTQELPGAWFGLCRKCPGMHAAMAVTFSGPEAALPAAPDGGSPASRPGRIRDGFGIARAGIRALVRDRQLRGFAFLAGLIMLFLVLVEAWNHRYIDPAFPAVFTLGTASFSVSMQYLWIAIPVGETHFIFYFGFFLLELACIMSFIAVLSLLILYRSARITGTPFTVRSGLAALRSSLGSLAVLSLVMALAATIGSELTFNNPLFSGIISTVMQLFWLPWAYYEPHNWMLSAFFYSATFVSISDMAINILLIAAAMYLVPAVILEKKGLVPAACGSFLHLKRTWREVLGCLIVVAGVILGITALGVLIGQLPALLNHDYDFFISPARGYFPMMGICYGLIAAAWILMAAGFSAAGVAIADLYTLSRTGRLPEPER